MKVIKACIKDIGLDAKQLSPRVVKNAISSSKNRGEDVEMFASKVEYADERRAAMARVYKMYEERLNNANALDFDDLMIKTVDFCEPCRKCARNITTNSNIFWLTNIRTQTLCSLSLIKYLTEKQQNICVVGDPDQSIYGFREADIRNILEFEDHYPNAKTILLEQNYRSTQTIFDIADAVIQNNTQRKKKKLWTDKKGGEKIFYFQAFDSDGEGRFVAAKIYDHLRHESERKDRHSLSHKRPIACF